MRCIDSDLIQRYVDEELTKEEATLIEGHIKYCKACEAKISNQRKLATHVKDTINLLTEEAVGIPEFDIPQNREKMHGLTSRRLIYGVAAACITVLLLIIFQNKDTGAENNEYIMQIVEYDYDANRSVSDQKLIIEIIDPEGNLSEYFLE
jgi:predicted anti-sigma-YlaC factor YlaD